MAIGEKRNFDKSELKPTAMKGKERGRSKRIGRDRDSIYIKACFYQKLPEIDNTIGWRRLKTPGPRLISRAYDAPRGPKTRKKCLLIANYALNARKQPCKALQTACNALGIYFYTLRIKRFTALVCPIVAYAPILCPIYAPIQCNAPRKTWLLRGGLPSPTAIRTAQKPRLLSPPLLNSELWRKKIGLQKQPPKIT